MSKCSPANPSEAMQVLCQTQKLREQIRGYESNPLWAVAAEALNLALEALNELQVPRCRGCGGDGIKEIQSGPYFDKCSDCGGTGERKP